jgi:hypothetical protein
MSLDTIHKQHSVIFKKAYIVPSVLTKWSKFPLEEVIYMIFEILRVVNIKITVF